MRGKVAKRLRKLAQEHGQATELHLQPRYKMKKGKEWITARFGKIKYVLRRGKVHIDKFIPNSKYQGILYCTGIRKIYKQYKKQYKKGELL